LPVAEDSMVVTKLFVTIGEKTIEAKIQAKD
jgi:hypothetical protein